MKLLGGRKLEATHKSSGKGIKVQEKVRVGLHAVCSRPCPNPISRTNIIRVHDLINADFMYLIHLIRTKQE